MYKHTHTHAYMCHDEVVRNKYSRITRKGVYSFLSRVSSLIFRQFAASQGFSAAFDAARYA